MNPKAIVKQNGLLLRLATPPYRLWRAFRYLSIYARGVIRWLVASRELTNYTYELPNHNVRELNHLVARALDVDLKLVERYFDELETDAALREHIARRTKNSRYRFTADETARYGQRLAWYAVVRLCRPSIVIETGLDKGLGTCAMAAALLRNAEDGAPPGRLYAIDIDPSAGWLVGPPYDTVVKFISDDSHAALRRIDEPVDLFIYDSVRNSVHEEREYDFIAGRFRHGSVIISTTTHHSAALMDFAEARGESYYSWLEIPKGHFYLGGGLGLVKIEGNPIG